MQSQIDDIKTATREQEKEIIRLQMRLDDFRQKAQGYDAIGERIATCEAYDKSQDSRLDRMETRINDLSQKVAENSVKELLGEEREQNRQQTKQIASLAQMVKEEREHRKEIRQTIADMRDVLSKSSDSDVAEAAKGIVINVEGGKGGDEYNATTTSGTIKQAGEIKE